MLVRKTTLSRRSFLSISSALAAGAALAACVPAPADTAGPADAAPEMEPVEISTWTQDHNDVVRAVISDELIPELLEMNPDISDVNFEWLPWGAPFFEKLATSIASDTMPDVWEPALAGFGDVYREGWAIPVDDYIADSTLISQDDFIASAFSACVHEGQQFGTPHRQDVRTWFYRKSHFEEAGVTEAPGTWDEQLEAAVKATKREGDVLIQAGYPPFPGGGPPGNQWFMSLLYQAGGDMLSPDNARAAFNTAEGLISMEFSLEILDAIYPDQVFQLPEAAVPHFVSGKVPVGFGSGTVRLMRTHAPDQLDDIWFAGAIEGRGPKATKAAWAGPGAKYIWHNSEHPDQSWKLIEFLNSPEYGVRWLEPYGQLPASKAVLNAGFWSENPLDIAMAEEADAYGRSMVFMPEPGKMHADMGREVAKVMFHEQTPQEGLDAAEKAWNETLSKYYP